MDPRGLYNLGNTCYINTTLQCLGFCHCFLVFVLRDMDTNNSELAAQLKKLYNTLFNGPSKIVSPRALLIELQEKCKAVMYLGEQNDIHEFLCMLLDKLNVSIAGPMPDVAPNTAANGNIFMQHSHTMDVAWHAHHQREFSPFVPMMYSQIISQIVCNCNAVHHNYEVQMNIMLPIVANSLQDCLDAYFADEKVSSDWKCDKCQCQGSQNVRTIKVWRHPQILILVLKRFDDNMRKITKHVQVPTRIDLKKHSIPRCPEYVLRSVAFHQGNVMGGHYFACCHDGKVWSVMDDETVSSAPQDMDLGQGYVFFYEAAGRSAPRS